MNDLMQLSFEKRAKIKVYLVWFGLLKVLLLFWALKAFFYLPATGGNSGPFGFSILSALTPFFLLSLIDLSWIFGTAWGLGQQRVWALYSVLLMALLNLPSLCFPFSLLIVWTCLPNELQASFRSQLVSLRDQKFPSSDATDPSKHKVT